MDAEERERPTVPRSLVRGGARAAAVLARGSARGFARSTRPVRRMWASDEALDHYALVHLASAAADATVGVALANSVFFSVPVGKAKVKVALYLALTMGPLAVASPMLAPLLDRGGFRRAISFFAAVGRMGVAIYAAPRVHTLVLFPAAFVLLVLSKVHAITKNGLTMAYAPAGEGLVKVNARLGRLAVVGGLVAAVPAVAFGKLIGAESVLYLAAALYAVTALLTLRLPRADAPPPEPGEEPADRLGRLPHLGTAAAGTASLRAASGFLLFLLAFALRRGGHPTYWFGALAGAALVGGFLGDVFAPRLPRAWREESVVFGSLVGAGVAALVAAGAFELPILAAFAGLAGMATEFGRLAFQSLMQRAAPEGAQGRVFARYEIVFQLSWVAGAFLPAVLPIPFRLGILLLAAFYLALGLFHVLRPRLQHEAA